MRIEKFKTFGFSLLCATMILIIIGSWYHRGWLWYHYELLTAYAVLFAFSALFYAIGSVVEIEVSTRTVIHKIEPEVKPITPAPKPELPKAEKDEEVFKGKGKKPLKERILKRVPKRE